MDVTAWRVSLVGNSGNYDNQPGLALRVQLKCRVCDALHEFQYARTIRPAVGNDGKRYGIRFTGAHEKRFQFAVKDRLGQAKNCEECGTISVIPPRQQETLIDQTEEGVTLDWMERAIDQLDFEIYFVEESEHYAAYHAFRQKPGQVDLDWVLFGSAVR